MIYKNIQRLFTTAFALAVLNCSLICGAHAAQEPLQETAEETTAAMIVDARLLNYGSLTRQIEHYRALVKQHFGVSLLLVPGDVRLSPPQIRQQLIELHEEQGIQGAFFVGPFGFARFQNASGDKCTLPEYYEDLDGHFEDTDGDGLFDVYDPWAGTAKEDAPGGIDIWVAALKPYIHDAQDYRRPQEIATYFQKVNRDIQGQSQYQKSAQIFTSRDWPDQKALIDSLRELYAEPTSLIGGYDGAGQATKTSTTQFLQAASRQSEMMFVFAHSGPSQHVFDLPEYPGNLVLPGVLDYPGRALLEDTTVRPKIMLLWGCHTADLEGVNYMNNRFLADSYLLTPANSVLTLLANSKSIGLEDLPFLVRNLKGQPLHKVWPKYLNHVYEKPFLRSWLGDRGVWDKERNGFNWGYIICGNPFTRVG